MPLSSLLEGTIAIITVCSYSDCVVDCMRHYQYHNLCITIPFALLSQQSQSTLKSHYFYLLPVSCYENKVRVSFFLSQQMYLQASNSMTGILCRSLSYFPCDLHKVGLHCLHAQSAHQPYENPQRCGLTSVLYDRYLVQVIVLLPL